MPAHRAKHNRPADLLLGPLPCDRINAALGLELEPGEVVFSTAAQLHAARRHGDEYARCLPFVGLVVAEPLYVGDDFNNHGKIELITRVAAMGQAILVALSIEPDSNGNYHVTSLYPISFKKADLRRQKGFLKHCR